MTEPEPRCYLHQPMFSALSDLQVRALGMVELRYRYPDVPMSVIVERVRKALRAGM